MKRRVSIIIPSYNHEKYVGQAIKSVLDQTFQDFEIVITDDGSTDGTVNEVRKFNDPRVRLFTLKENQGAAVANLNCIAKARGEYFAMLSSDDIFLPEKLEKQVKYLDEHQDVVAVFSYAQIIGEEGDDFIDDKHFYYNIFKQPNRSRFEWLNFFFYRGNCLCHPSVLVRRDHYTKIAPPDPRFAQIGDFNRWINICLKHEIYIFPENLVKFRVRSGDANASGNRPEVMKRSGHEFLQVLRNFLKIETPEELIKIFPESSKYCDPIERDLIPFCVAMIAFDTGTIYPFHQIFGLNVIFELLKDKSIAERLERKCGFKYIDFIKMTGMHDLFNIQKLAERDHQLAERDQKINALMNTYSWKVTKPLRWLFNRL